MGARLGLSIKKYRTLRHFLKLALARNKGSNEVLSMYFVKGWMLLPNAVPLQPNRSVSGSAIPG
jgi:hypothetical protein